MHLELQNYKKVIILISTLGLFGPPLVPQCDTDLLIWSTYFIIASVRGVESHKRNSSKQRSTATQANALLLTDNDLRSVSCPGFSLG